MERVTRSVHGDVSSASVSAWTSLNSKRAAAFHCCASSTLGTQEEDELTVLVDTAALLPV